MLVIGGVMGRGGEGEARMIAAMFAGRKRLALHHRYWMLVLMNAVMDDVVNSRSGAQIAWFEFFHFQLRPRGRLSQRRMGGSTDRLAHLSPRRRGEQQ